MNVTKIPFNEFIGLEYSDNPAYLMTLQERPEYRNHLGTVHASVMFALAEPTSGLFLSSELPGISNVVPVVRKVEVKYRKPANGQLYSRASFEGTDALLVKEQLLSKGRALVSVSVTISDANGNDVMLSVFEWYLATIV